MKDIMHKESSEKYEGVASFSFIPVKNMQLSFLPQYSKTLEELKEELLETFKGQTIAVGDIIDNHHVGTRFIKKNYKDVLREMEEEEIITANPSKENRKTGTMADHVKITFTN